MSQKDYSNDEVITLVTPTFIIMTFGLQVASMVLLSLLDTNPFILVHSIALVSTCYILRLLTIKYERPFEIWKNPKIVKYTALSNFTVALSLWLVTGGEQSIPQILSTFIFITLFSLLGVMLEKWLRFLRDKRSNKKAKK